MGEELRAKLGLDISPFERALNRAVRSASRIGSRVAKSFGVMRRAARRVAVAVLAIGAALLGLGALAVREFVQWEAAMVGVAKTVDATIEQITELGQAFIRLSEVIPVSAVALANIGELAGQLGVQVPNILAFTEVIAALAVSTNLTAEAAATDLAQFMNVMGTMPSQIGRLGSAISLVGQASATNEAQIVSFASRMAGAGAIAGLTESAVLGIAAAMASVGIEAEAGGTAVQKVLIDMNTAVIKQGKMLEALAEVAGLTAAEFSRAWRDDAGEVFTLFVEGLGRAGGSAAIILEDLGLGNQRLVRSFLSLSNAGELLREKLDVTAEGWRENTALTKEAAQFYDRTGARLVVLRNKISNTAAAIGESLTPIVETGIEVMSGFLDTIRDSGPAIDVMATAMAERLPGAIQSVVRGVGSLGIALLEAVEIVSGLQFAAGLGLVGLIFLGPQGAAALGAIGFVIDALIDKLGGPVTVAERLNEQIEEALERQALLTRAFSEGGRVKGLGFVEAGDLRLRQEFIRLNAEIDGFRLSIANLTAEDFVPVGDGIGQWSVALSEVFMKLQEFEVKLGAVGGELEDGPIGGDSPLEGLNNDLGRAGEQADELSDLMKRIGETIENQIIGGVAELALNLDDMIGTLKSIGRAIFREIVANLIKAKAAGEALSGVFTAAGPLGLAFGAFGLISQFFSDGGIVHGNGAVPIVAHAGEVVLSREAVGRMGGPEAANQLNRASFGSEFFAPSAPSPAPAMAAAGGGSSSVMVEFRMQDVPEPTDFGIIATRPQVARLFSEMLRNHRRNGGV